MATSPNHKYTSRVCLRLVGYVAHTSEYIRATALQSCAAQYHRLWLPALSAVRRTSGERWEETTRGNLLASTRSLLGAVRGAGGGFQLGVIYFLVAPSALPASVNAAERGKSITSRGIKGPRLNERGTHTAVVTRARARVCKEVAARAPDKVWMKVEALQSSVFSLRLRVLSTSIFHVRACAAPVPRLWRVRRLSSCLSRSWLGFTGDSKPVVGGEIRKMRSSLKWMVTESVSS